MNTDPIADYLTRVRNALKAGKKFVDIPMSNVKRAITELLVNQKFFNSYEVVEMIPRNMLRIHLKYYLGEPVINGLQRVSKPGLRIYSSTESLPKIFNGLGIAVVSTSHGLMTDKQARTQGVGGEVLCYVW